MSSEEIKQILVSQYANNDDYVRICEEDYILSGHYALLQFPFYYKFINHKPRFTPVAEEIYRKNLSEGFSKDVSYFRAFKKYRRRAFECHTRMCSALIQKGYERWVRMSEWRASGEKVDPLTELLFDRDGCLADHKREMMGEGRFSIDEIQRIVDEVVQVKIVFLDVKW